ncbi:MAG: GNAT family N-acetyltransferase [Alphaproteobacteria bacterium]|nr:GNAT family N-acetyltransferase [Alphaproteobacteria bacterium]
MNKRGHAIRSAATADAAAMQAIYAPIVETTAISFEEIPPTVEEMAERVETTLRSYPYLVAENGGRVVGFAYASQHRARAAYRRSVDVTVYVAEHARGAGVGRALYGDLLPMLAERGFHAAFGGIALPNPGSVALHEAMGFEHVGVYREVGFKLGRWHDVGWWQRLLT